MDWAYLLDKFDGRIGRKTFWIAMSAVGVANFAVCYIAKELDGDKLSAIIDLAFNYPEFAIAVKRGYDRNLPFWVPGMFFAASVLLDMITVLGWAGTDQEPSALALVIAVPFTVLGVGLLIELGFRKGTPGSNKYGADPLGPRLPPRA